MDESTNTHSNPQLSQQSHPQIDTNPPSQPTTQTSKQSNHKLIYLVLILIILLLVGVIGILTTKITNPSQDFSPTSSPQSIETPETFSTPTTISDPTISWHTYSNSEYGFSFKYPDTWFSENCGQPPNVLLLNPNEKPICPTEPQDPIVIHITPFIKTLSEYDKVWNSDSAYAAVDQSIYSVPETTAKRYKIIKKGIAPGPDNFEIIAVQLPNAIGIFKLNQTQYSQVLDQILSTFKFTSEDPLEQARTEAAKHIPESQQINSVGYLGTHKDKYIVGINDPSVASGGSILLIGKSATGEWVVPPGGSLLYCEWINTANLGEADKVFYGQSCF